MLTRRQATFAFVGAVASFAAERDRAEERVRLVRAPESGIQPQAVMGSDGELHLISFHGEASHGDVRYTHSRDGGSTFADALRVNSQPGSAIATGTIRGAQLALGKAGRIHVAWNGSNLATPKGPINPDSGQPGSPMLYSRLGSAGTFEPQRNLMIHSFGLDGGGSIAADSAGNVYVAWHGIAESEAKGTSLEGEARRSVWLAKSADDGRSFVSEQKAWAKPTGACGCCGMKIFADHQGNLSALYRSATESVHRDIYQLRSTDGGRSFDGGLLHRWEINACPMSSMDIAENGGVTAGTWETAGQVYWTRFGQGGPKIMAAPGEGKGRKHPRIAMNSKGETLLVWTEGTGWQRGGSLAWQMYGPDGRAASDVQRAPGIPAWSFAAVVARPDNGFTIIY